MHHHQSRMDTVIVPLIAAVILAVGLSLAGIVDAKDVSLTLQGSEEVPASNSTGSGGGTITVNDDLSVSGSVTTSGIVGTKAHIHAGAFGQNGPAIIDLEKTGENTWTVPAGARLTAEQYRRFKAGDLYLNVHTATHPGGDIRGQITS